MSDPVLDILLIEPDGTVEQRNQAEMSVGDAQALLEDDFEILQPTNPPPFVMLVAMNGKQKGLVPNWKATRIMSSILRPGDFIVGRAIITGPPNNIGDLTSVTPEIRDVVADRTAR